MSDYNSDILNLDKNDEKNLITLPEPESGDVLDSSQYTESIVTIQTHDKRFHIDDVGATALLVSYYNKKRNFTVQLIRSRDQELLETSDILVDVGGIYDPSNRRFDHHQDGCNEVFEEGFKIPLSSIGMVWKHYGEELLRMYIQSNPEFYLINKWEDHIKPLLTEVYAKIIQEIDAHDNGIVPVEGGKRNYWQHLSLGEIISSMNTSDTNNETEQMRAFRDAIQLFVTIFEIKLEKVIRKYFDYNVNYSIVEKVLKESVPNSEYLVITDKLPMIHKCLNVLDPDYRIKFLIFHPSDEEYITVKTRNKKDDMFTSLVPLLSYDRTVEKLGDDEKKDLIFIHKSLFIAKTKTLDLALKLVGLALENRPKTISSTPRSYFKLPSFAETSLSYRIISGVIGTISVGLAGYYIFHKSD
jgi:uncharacterized UPF0160 family protein